MAGTPNYNQPVFAAEPFVVAKLSSVSATVDIQGALNVETLYTSPNGEAGAVIKRVTVSMITPLGNTSSAQIFYLLVFDPITGQHCLYQQMAVAATTPSDTVPQATAVFDIDTGLALQADAILSIARTANVGADDSFHVVVEGGTLEKV